MWHKTNIYLFCMDSVQVLSNRKIQYFRAYCLIHYFLLHIAFLLYCLWCFNSSLSFAHVIWLLYIPGLTGLYFKSFNFHMRFEVFVIWLSISAKMFLSEHFYGSTVLFSSQDYYEDSFATAWPGFKYIFVINVDLFNVLHFSIIFLYTFNSWLHFFHFQDTINY